MEQLRFRDNNNHRLFFFANITDHRIEIRSGYESGKIIIGELPKKIWITKQKIQQEWQYTIFAEELSIPNGIIHDSNFQIDLNHYVPHLNHRFPFEHFTNPQVLVLFIGSDDDRMNRVAGSRGYYAISEEKDFSNAGKHLFINSEIDVSGKGLLKCKYLYLS